MILFMVCVMGWVWRTDAPDRFTPGAGVWGAYLMIGGFL